MTPDRRDADLIEIQVVGELLTQAECDELEAMLAKLFLPSFTARERYIARLAAKNAFRLRAGRDSDLTALRAKVEQLNSRYGYTIPVSKGAYGPTLREPAVLVSDVLALLASPPPSPEPQTWQPMETAPKDGTNILLTDGRRVSQGGWFHQPEGEPDATVGWWSVDCIVDPTNWMHMPAPTGADHASVGRGGDHGA